MIAKMNAANVGRCEEQWRKKKESEINYDKQWDIGGLGNNMKWSI